MGRKGWRILTHMPEKWTETCILMQRYHIPWCSDWYLFDNIIRYAGQRILPDVKILTPVPKSLGTASESLSLLAQLIQRSQTVNTQTYFSIFPLQHTQLHSSGPFLKQPQFHVRSHLDFHQPPASVPVLNSPLHSAPHGRGIQLHNFLAAPCL